MFLCRTTLDDRALGAALAYAVDVKNAVVVAAAGNVGGPGQCRDQNPAADPARPGQPDWTDVNVLVSPAWYDDYVLTVGSVGSDGVASQFSLAGPWVDVAAPGEDVVSLDPDGEGLVDTLATAGGETPISGTSYAAPVVTGIVALLRVALTGIDRATGHAAHRGHGAPPSCRLGSRRRPRHRRRTRGGDRRSHTSAAPGLAAT